MRDHAMKQLTPSQFLSTLQRAAKSKIALILHQSADPDAIGSAAALAQLLSLLTDCECHIFAESLNRSAKQLVTTFRLELTNPDTLKDFSVLVLVDLNNLEQTGTLAAAFPTNKVTIFCVDHHVFHGELTQVADFVLHDDHLRSTAELVLQLWEASGKPMPSDVATLLACGLVYDSRHFHIATNTTFTHFMALLAKEADYQQVLSVLSTPLEKSERIARLKAAQRVVVYDEFGLLIAATIIRSYEASVCRALIGLGADIAIASATKNDEVRLSARCTQDVVSSRSLDLAKDVMEPLGELIGGAGGGHPSAAGANGNASSDHALGLALQLIRKALKAHDSTSNPGPLGKSDG